MRVEGNTVIRDGVIRLIYDRTCEKLVIIEDYDNPVTLSQLLEMAKFFGYVNRRPNDNLIVMWQTLTKVALYRCNCYEGEKWEKLGDLEGFA